MATPPPPDQVHSGPRLAETDTPQRYRAAARIIRAAQRRSRRVVSQPPCRRLAVAPPFGRAARRRRCGAARCRSEPVLAPCLALRRVHSPAPAPHRRAAFRPRRVQAPVWRSEVPVRARARSLPCAAPLVALGCLALRCVLSPAPAPQRRAAFRPRRVQAPVWRSEAPARARARSAPSAAPLVALSCPALCCLAVRYQRSLAAISSCGAGRQRRSGRGGLMYPMCVRVGDSASRPAQLGPSASGVA